MKTLWTDDDESAIAKESGFPVYPGMMFSLAKERMEKSVLWSIVKELPKGALLHCHLAAMVDLDWIVRTCLADFGECLYLASRDRPIVTEAHRASADITLVYIPTRPITGWKQGAGDGEVDAAAAAAGASIWKADYVVNTPVPAILAARTFPDGGFEGFVSWLVSRCTITPEESLKHVEGVNEIWRKFQSTFGVVSDMVFYEPMYRLFLRKFFSELAGDLVRWVDIRTVFITPLLRTGQDEYDTDFMSMISVFEEELERFKKTKEGSRFWGARIIWSGLRAHPKYDLVKTMKDCVQVKLRYPHLIAGFDLVGQEDLGRPLSDLVSEIFWFRKHCAENGVDIPLFFHAGETVATGGPTDDNLYDAILMGTRRIGHGFSLFKHPLLIDLVKDQKILIESCPISNEILRLTNSIMTHPLPALLARGVPACLCNDDPAILGQVASGMTHDFWQALQGWNNLGLAGIGSLAENSVRWAAFEDCDAKTWKRTIDEGRDSDSVWGRRLREWEEDWEEYCDWIVFVFGRDWLDPEYSD